jgi:hypothetical protein
MSSQPSDLFHLQTITTLAVLFGLCTAAQANPGTAIVYRTATYLIIGNAIIALIEYLIARKFGARKKSFRYFLAGNYLSAWAGVIVLWIFGTSNIFLIGVKDPMRAAFIDFATVIIAMVVLTIAVEWGFFWVAFSKPDRSFRRVAKTFLIAHVATYGALLIYYAPSANYNLITNYAWVNNPAEVISSKNMPWVYYIEPDTNQIWRIHADGSNHELVGEGPPHRQWRLCAVQSDNGGFSLAIIDAKKIFNANGGRRDIWEYSPPLIDVVVEQIGEAASIFEERAPYREDRPLSDIRMRESQWYLVPGAAAYLRPATQNDLFYHWYSDPYEGMILQQGRQTRKIHFYTGMTSSRLLHQDLTALPDSFLVWSIAYTDGLLQATKPETPQAIYVMSQKDKRIARLAFGRSPIVAYEIAPEGWIDPLKEFRKTEP